MSANDQILTLLGAAKKLAQKYRSLTGKPLGITGEVAEYEAARILGVELTPARQAGSDAVELVDGTPRRLQIKGRCLLEGCKPGQRLGSIRVDKDWDAVLMVLLDQNFDAIEIYEAERGRLGHASGSGLQGPQSAGRHGCSEVPIHRQIALGASQSHISQSTSVDILPRQVSRRG